MMRAVVSFALPGASPATMVSIFPCHMLASDWSTLLVGCESTPSPTGGDVPGLAAGEADGAAAERAGLAAAAGDEPAVATCL